MRAHGCSKKKNNQEKKCLDWWTNGLPCQTEGMNPDGSKGDSPSVDWATETGVTTAGLHLVSLAPELHPEYPDSWVWFQMLWLRDEWIWMVEKRTAGVKTRHYVALCQQMDIRHVEGTSGAKTQKYSIYLKGLCRIDCAMESGKNTFRQF